jgi:glutamate synthase domain-containing protein 2
MYMNPQIIVEGLNILGAGLVVAFGVLLAAALTLTVIDLLQHSDAVRHNFPLIGRFRGLFIKLGEFFRQYFFAMDREEMPFNRAERNWVYNAAKNTDNTVAFGSTKVLSPGTPIFVNCPFPVLDEQAAKTVPLVLGPYARQPYRAASIVNISGMSYGALSRPAVLALSRGAKLAGIWMNTGEGGLSPHHLEGGGDIVFQIGTAKYGVRTPDGKLDDAKLAAVAAHPQVVMFEIKFSQGAKPGKGGILPAVKVTEEIAAIRGIPAGQDSISPNGHPEVRSVNDMLDFIAHVRQVTGKPTGIKAVLGAYGWLHDLCREINRRGPESAPDFFTLDSGDGGTGAAPLALLDNVGLTISESLPLLHDILVQHGLEQRIPINASGKLLTPAEVAWALCAGASFVHVARGFLFALGCIQALKCNKNTCPTGITTHNPRLQAGLDPADKAVKVANYAKNLTHDVEVIAHSCGVREPRELRRHHVRIVQANGLSVPLNDIYPQPRLATTAA